MKLDDVKLAIIKEGNNIHEVIQEHLDNCGDPDYVDNLIHLCEQGGCPDEDDDPEYHVEEVEVKGTTCIVRATAYTKEKYFGGGCPDMPTITPRTGEVEFEIDIETGEIDWG